jgi:hypothetical protein
MYMPQYEDVLSVPSSNECNEFFYNFPPTLSIEWSRDSSVGIAMGSTAGLRFPTGPSDFSPLHSVQTGSGTHPAPYTMNTRACFPEVCFTVSSIRQRSHNTLVSRFRIAAGVTSVSSHNAPFLITFPLVT